MSLQAVGTATQPQESQWWSTFPNSRKYTINFPQMAHNLGKIAVPLIISFALSNLPGASAGPIEYAVCITGCTLFGTPAAFPVCSAFCLPILFLPGP